MAVIGKVALPGLQRTIGNSAVARLVSEAKSTNRVPNTRVVLQRQDPPAAADPDLEELRRLNGLPMNFLLAQLDGLGTSRRGELRPKIRSAWGVGFERMELAFQAADAKGTAAMDFAFAHYDQLRKLGYRDQRDAILRFVDPGFQPPKKLEPGDKLRIDGLLAIVHRGHIRKQRSEKDGLPWIAYNPGAVGNPPSFKLPGGYGKTIGPAAINIYGSYDEGIAALVAWIQFQAKAGLTFAGYFGAHAPADDGSAANKGNDPKLYFEKVARQMGLDPAKPGTAATPLAKINVSALAAAVAAVGEGYTLGGETLQWPKDEARLDRKTWFAMMYWETAAPKGP